MPCIVLDRIEADIDVAALKRELRIVGTDAATTERFRRLTAAAVEHARPKGVYKAAECELWGSDAVRVDGIILHSRLLAAHLAEVRRVFPFVATCGSELADWAAAKADLLERYWLEAIMDAVLACTHARLREHIVAVHGLRKTAVMNPGSLPDWPLEEQKPLFAILGDVEAAVGVRLRESLMMEPRYSVSGILFPAEVDFQSCMLCPRENCPKRRTPFRGTSVVL